jgi:Zn-dependent protease
MTGRRAASFLLEWPFRRQGKGNELPDIQSFVQDISIWAIPVVIAITFHEAAHGWVAWKKGDPTAKMLGRVTLNPIPHIDPIGTIAIPLALRLLNTGMMFGYAKPVPVNFRLLHDQKRDPVYVSAAGVVTNLMLAAISGVLLRIISHFDPVAFALAIPFGYFGHMPTGEVPAGPVMLPVALMLAASVHINVILAVFNLVPIPPLDGGRIAVGLLPYRASQSLASVERYGMPILILLMMSGILWRLMGPPMIMLLRLFLGAYPH